MKLRRPAHRPRRLTDGQSARIADAYLHGESVASLAEDYQVSEPTIYRTLKREGVRSED